MKSNLLLIILAFCCLKGYSQPSSRISKLDTYTNTYSDELRGYRLAVIGRKDITTTDKYDLYIKKKMELTERFKVERKEEYLALNGAKFCADHSCTKGTSGGTKDCGWVDIDVPKGFKKIPGTFKLEKGVPPNNIRETENGGGIRLQKSSKGSVKSTYCAKYDVDPTFLSSTLIIEARKLIGDIVASHKKAYPDEGPYW